MPLFRPDTLRQIGCELFEAAGCCSADARAVADHLVESNLFGHDSHGAIRFYEYAEGLRSGLYQARTVPEVIRQTPCTAVVDGHGALGPIGATFATRLAMEKAKAQGLNDLLVFGMVALTALSSGFLHEWVGWRALNYSVLPAVLLALGMVLWLGRRRQTD